MFEPTSRLLLGFITGVVFGVLLQKGRVARFPVIIGQFLFRDWTVVKIIATAVAVGAVGVYAMNQAGFATLAVRPLQVGAVVVGGILFAIGMVVLRYCPGTSVAACAEGRRDAMAGVLGMLGGAGVYVGLYGRLTPLREAWDLGRATLPQVTGISPWAWILALLVGVGIMAVLLERPRRRPPSQPRPYPHDPGMQPA